MTGYTQTDTSKSIPARLTTTTMKAVYQKAKQERFKGDAENLLQGHGLHSTEPSGMPSGRCSVQIHITRSHMILCTLTIVESRESTCGLSSRPFLQPLGSKAYPILRNTIFNISTAQSAINFAAEPTATWMTRTDKSAMLKVYSDFCPHIVRMLELVPEGEVCEWKLCMHHPLRMTKKPKGERKRDASARLACIDRVWRVKHLLNIPQNCRIRSTNEWLGM
ncbi:hypothetical protein B0H14DRAFT_2621248 [Mycena olivaceomarginata]|nr:hypothetical protein B0H14DRAFT_2621248 [Mycena olivaceomarginata]